MSNFARALRLALRHRITVCAAIVCSLMVAVLWAGNITAVLPIVDGVMHGKSMPDLLSERLVESEQRVAALQDSIDALDGQDLQTSLNERKALELDLAAENAWVTSLQAFHSWAKRWMPSTAFGTLVVICLALFAGTVLKNLFRIAGLYFMARLGQVVDFELRKQFYRRTLRLDLGTFRETSQGDLMNRFTTEISWISKGVSEVFGTAVREPLKMIACLVGAAFVSWQLLLLTLISAPLAIYAIRWLAKALKRANRRAAAGFSIIFDHLEESFDAIKLIKGYTMESHERSRFHRVSKKYYKHTMRIALYDSLASPLAELIGIGMILAAIMAGGYLVLNQQTHLFGIRISDEPLTNGWLTLFYAMLAGASDPARRLSAVFNRLQRAAAASDRVFELFDRSTLLQEPAVPMTLPADAGRVQLHDVSFGYHAGQPVLQDISLDISPGETIAIVGPNGCGKSTLANLIARFHDPTAGSIALEGTDLRSVRLGDLRSRLGIVSQETLLLDDTVENNIIYGSRGASHEAVVAAATKAHAHQFITTKLPDGYDSICGNKGNRLSGGQRQRIALARAILRDPEILILDEATSQVDVESERLIHDVLEQFVQNRTAIMITHRPSTLALAERIVVMDQGRIVDVGSFDELSGRCGLFRRLAQLDYRESA